MMPTPHSIDRLAKDVEPLSGVTAGVRLPPSTARTGRTPTIDSEPDTGNNAHRQNHSDQTPGEPPPRLVGKVNRFRSGGVERSGLPIGGTRVGFSTCGCSAR